MQERTGDEQEGARTWADILAERSPEGREIVDALLRAETAVLAAQKHTIDAMMEHRECSADYAAYEQAIAKVQSLRQQVYKLARQ